MGGRPPLFPTPDDLQAKVDEYFLTGRPVKQMIVGQGNNQRVVDLAVPTITGMALYLGFLDRNSLYDVEEREGFSSIIKKARARIVQHYEELLQTGMPAGPIFALKNLDGWRDNSPAPVVGELHLHFNNVLQEIRHVRQKAAEGAKGSHAVHSLNAPATT